MSLRALLARLTRRAPVPAAPTRPCCAEHCPLAACAAGLCATVVCLHCPDDEATRLRTLGLFEGARVGVLHARQGVLLDVRGARLALSAGLSAAITVRPEAG